MEHVQQEEGVLLATLQRLFPQSSTSTLRKMLTQGRVMVNETVVYRAKHSLLQGDNVRVLDRQKAEEHSPPPPTQPPVDLDILYEDDSLLVVNKPALLLSIATDKLEPDTLHSRCVQYLQQQNKKNWSFIVHRLDKDTSGLMVFAKHKEAKNELQHQFQQRNVHRIYRALVEGVPHTSSGTVHSWLFEDKHLNVVAVNKKHPKAKEAISHYSVLERGTDTSLVELSIETGRRHQIRMAMQHIGTPVVGDARHGASTNPHGRVMLHAYALEFLHPDTDDPVRFEAPMPKGFQTDGWNER